MTEDRFRFAKERPRPAQGSREFLRVCRHPSFAEPTENFAVGPLGCSVERKRQTVLRQIDGSGYEIVDRCESSFTEHVVIDDAEILEVSIAVAQCAIQHDQRE